MFSLKSFLLLVSCYFFSFSVLGGKVVWSYIRAPKKGSENYEFLKSLENEFLENLDCPEKELEFLKANLLNYSSEKMFGLSECMGNCSFKRGYMVSSSHEIFEAFKENQTNEIAEFTNKLRLIRFNIEEKVVKYAEKFSKDNVLTYLSCGSGGFFQDFIIISKLAKLGFRKFKIILIDPRYKDCKHKKFVLSRLSFSILLSWLRDEDKLIDNYEVITYDDANDYITDCLKDDSFKADLCLGIDIGGLIYFFTHPVIETIIKKCLKPQAYFCIALNYSLFFAEINTPSLMMLIVFGKKNRRIIKLSGELNHHIFLESDKWGENIGIPLDSNVKFSRNYNIDESWMDILYKTFLYRLNDNLKLRSLEDNKEAKEDKEKLIKNADENREEKSKTIINKNPKLDVVYSILLKNGLLNYLDLLDLLKISKISIELENAVMDYLKVNFLTKLKDFFLQLSLKKIKDSDIKFLLNWLDQKMHLFNHLRDEKGNNALHLAASYENCFDFIKLFIKNGIDVNSQNKEGTTSLHLSTLRSDYMRIAEFLLESGANIDVCSKEIKGTVLSWAVLANRVDLVSKLIDLGAAMPIDDFGYNLLHYAVWNDYPGIAKKLIEADINLLYSERDGITPFHLGSYRGSLETLKVLISFGVDINRKTQRYGLSALIWAALEKQYSVVEYLLGFKDINEEDKYYLFNYACMKEDLILLKILADAKINLLHRFKDGLTALHLTVDKGKLLSVKFLTKEMMAQNIANEGVNSKEYLRGFTALHLASLNGDLEMVRYLLSLDCIDVTIHDNLFKPKTPWGRIKKMRGDVYRQITKELDERWRRDLLKKSL